MKMWKTFILNDNYYLFQVVVNNKEVIISFTDLQKIWMKNMSMEEILIYFKEMNPLLNQNEQETRSTCLATIANDHIDTLKFDDSQNCNLSFKQYFKGVPLKVEIVLEKQSENEFKMQLTIPMIQTVQYLEFKQRKLEKLLMQKDKELSEYNKEYGDLPRKNVLETEKYQPDTEIKTNLFLKVYSEDDKFKKTFAEKHGDVQQLFPEIKEDNRVEKRKLKLAPLKHKRR